MWKDLFITFSAPKWSAWRKEIATSDWTYYGFMYAGIFGTFSSVGILAAYIIGPSELAEERRKNRRPIRVHDLNKSAWGTLPAHVAGATDSKASSEGAR